MGGKIPDQGEYNLKLSLVWKDKSGNIFEKHSLKDHTFLVKEVFLKSIWHALDGLLLKFLAQTIIQQLLFLLSVLGLVAAVILIILWVHLRRKYRKVLIFISYRRTDAKDWAAKLYRELRLYFDRSELFYDIASIEVGSKFPLRIDESLSSSKVVLVLIGPEWARTQDAQGKIRLENNDDFVRREVLHALQNHKTVIPLLLNGARMPGSEDLPEALATLAERNAMALPEDPEDKDKFEDQVRLLVRVVKKTLGMADEV